MNNVYILSAVRTPIGKFGGSLAAHPLRTWAWSRLRQRSTSRNEPHQMEERLSSGTRDRPAAGPIRSADFDPQRSATGGSGLHGEHGLRFGHQGHRAGLQEIATGNLDCVLAGGTESMSRLPYYLDGARWGYRLGHQEVVDGMYRDGFFCPLAKMVMGETAEILAEQYKISREEQDQFALTSQQRASAARSTGRFDAEIVPVTIEGKKGSTVFLRDEHLFPDASTEKLAKLPPVFSKSGTITAGNSSGITDGAAALVLASETFVRRNSLKPLARIMAATSAGVDPRVMGIGPVPAIRKLESKHRLMLSDFDLVELNEAFAAQVLACDRELHFDRDRLNVNGGAIALGHPIGCTGARITVTLVHEMLKRKARRGLATLCVSGGMGMALAIENANASPKP